MSYDLFDRFGKRRWMMGTTQNFALDAFLK